MKNIIKSIILILFLCGVSYAQLTTLPSYVSGNFATTTQVNAKASLSGATYTGLVSFLVANGTGDLGVGATANGQTGTITITTVSITAGNIELMTVSNSLVTSSSKVILTLEGNTAQKLSLSVSDVATGSFRINIENLNLLATTTNDILITYFVTK